jgi:2-hydroxy-3-keto-5-methylthiopentenyl-1-phosphate phosphatase
MTETNRAHGKEYLFVTDFDQTLSFNDSGLVLSKMLGIDGFDERVAGLANTRLVQQGAELAYLLRHDPDFRRVRRDHLIEVGKQIRLKDHIWLLVQLLRDIEGYHFSFHVVSAAPQEVIQSALEGIVPSENIHGTELGYDQHSGEIASIGRVCAGYGKVAAVDELRTKLGVSHDRVVYVGDGKSDVHVMLHVNRLGGQTIAVSENRYLTQIAARTVLSDDALSVLVPILEDIIGWDPVRIRAFFETHDFVVQNWDKVRTDTLTLTKAA